MDWLAVSEMAFGRIIDGRENPAKYQASWFIPPYDDAFEKVKEGATRTDLIKILSISSYQAAVHAAQSLNGAGEDADWVALLFQRAKENELADECDKTSKLLRKGKEVNPVRIAQLSKDIANPARSGLINAATIDYSNFTELIPSGWDALDYNLGGIPHAAPLILGGETGIGKSYLTMIFVKKYLELYKDKVAVIYSREMPSEQYLSRADKIYSMGKMIADGRIHISDKTVNIDDIAVESASVPNNGLVVIDYIDYVIKQHSEEGYAYAYMCANDICRTQQIPLLMIAQPNRNQYTDVIPRMHHLRWSGMAENVAGGVIMIWKPKPGQTEDDHEEQEKASGFMYVEDSMYLVVWKWRAGWVGYDNNPPKDGKHRPGPGAIVLPKVNGIWADEKGRWLQYGNVRTSMKNLKRRKAQ